MLSLWNELGGVWNQLIGWKEKKNDINRFFFFLEVMMCVEIICDDLTYFDLLLEIPTEDCLTKNTQH